MKATFLKPLDALIGVSTLDAKSLVVRKAKMRGEGMESHPYYPGGKSRRAFPVIFCASRCIF
jgi:hypothetical protein